MSNDIEKASAFVGRLLNNPVLKPLCALQQEEQVLQFLKINAAKLYPTLASSAFFPDKTWEQIYNVLVQALLGITSRDFAVQLQGLVEDQIDLSFLDFFRGGHASTDNIKKALVQFVIQLLNVPFARKELVGPFNALKYQIVDRYIDEIAERREYGYFELTKVQRLKLGRDEIKNLVKVSLLLRPAAALLFDSMNAPNDPSGVIPFPTLDKGIHILQSRIGFLPEPVIKSGINSNASFTDNPFIEATARISASLSSMYRNYQPDQTLDRGAVGHDQSWLNIARRNFRFFGYDIKMLDEMYKISVECRW